MKIYTSRAFFSRQFILFVVGGVFSALVDVGSMVLMLHAEIDALCAATFGFALGLAVNYLFHVRITFASRNTLSAASRFIIIVLANYVITLVFVFVAQFLDVSVIGAKIASLPVVAINGFLFSKFWVFR